MGDNIIIYLMVLFKQLSRVTEKKQVDLTNDS